MDDNIIPTLARQSHRLNELSEDSLEKLLSELFEHYLRECGRLDLTSSDGQLLDSAFLSKFQTTLPSLNESFPLSSVLESLYRFIAQISRLIVKPKLVAKNLTEAGLNSSQVELFVRLWKSYAPLIIEKLKNASFTESAEQLRDVSWKVKLLTDQSYDSQQKLPLTELDLTLQPTTDASDKLSLNLTHDELLQFYENLEAIQTRIDQLHQR